MKATIRLKDFPGHEGIPGHQGGSLPRDAEKGGAGSTAVSSYEELDSTFETIRDSLKSGSYKEGWTNGGVTWEPKVTRNFDNGKIVVQIAKTHWVTGKFVSGTSAQQRYAMNIEVVEYRKKPDGSYQRWNAETLWKKQYNGNNDPILIETMKKRFVKLTGWQA